MRPMILGSMIFVGSMILVRTVRPEMHGNLVLVEMVQGERSLQRIIKI